MRVDTTERTIDDATIRAVTTNQPMSFEHPDVTNPGHWLLGNRRNIVRIGEAAIGPREDTRKLVIGRNR
jgi:hypothetical protein